MACHADLRPLHPPCVCGPIGNGDNYNNNKGLVIIITITKLCGLRARHNYAFALQPSYACVQWASGYNGQLAQPLQPKTICLAMLGLPHLWLPQSLRALWKSSMQNVARYPCVHGYNTHHLFIFSRAILNVSYVLQVTLLLYFLRLGRWRLLVPLPTTSKRL